MFIPPRFFSLATQIALVGLVAIELSGALCRTTVDDGTDAGVDAGPGNQLIACESADQCPDPANYDCLGVCLQRCAADTVCRPAEYCSPRGYCELGCRDSTTCPEGDVCVNGSCVEPGGVGACGTKCECLAGQVCQNGVCTDPPATCSRPEDCGRGQGDRCDAYQCNGFTGQCFDPDPQPCIDADDCIGRPGCGNDCVCTTSGQCVPGGACTVETEAADCGAGFYCDDTLNCAVLPVCTTATQCPTGLTCNTGTQQCVRPQPCTGAADCTSPPNTYCNLTAVPARCEQPNCQNGGVTCDPQTQFCTQDGRCVAAGTGAACTDDSECPNDAWPNTQYCSFESGAGECTPGCRSNASCAAGQTCNGARQCVQQGGGGGSGGQWGDSCMGDADCQAGLICGQLTGTCAELCTNPGSSCAGDPNCCPLSGAAECVSFLILGFCQN